MECPEKYSFKLVNLDFIKKSVRKRGRPKKREMREKSDQKEN